MFLFRSLYHTFGSPFSDTTCKPHEIGKSKVINKRLNEINILLTLVLAEAVPVVTFKGFWAKKCI